MHETLRVGIAFFAEFHLEAISNALKAELQEEIVHLALCQAGDGDLHGRAAGRAQSAGEEEARDAGGRSHEGAYAHRQLRGAAQQVTLYAARRVSGDETAAGMQIGRASC